MENINENVGENVVGLEEIESEDDGGNAFHYDSREFVIGVDSEANFVDINLDMLTEENLRKLNFANLDVAYNFYNNWYGKMKGFSARKGKERKNAMEEIIEKTYLCHREGKRPINTNEKMGKKKREAKPETRCLCPAKMKVRKLSEADIMEMNNMRNAGITTPQIYGSFVSQSGGYNNIGFQKRDLYNEIGRQRMLQLSDAKGAIKYLRERELNEGSMFWRHTTDYEGRLQRLFWCDNGDLAMRNATKRVLPNAHHRLCAWHLCRNAASNVKNPKMVSMFRKCMLGDYEVSEFKHRWEVMVKEFRLEENNWVKEMYEKKRMWATTYIRGNFFAGFRTTSRCEGLHGQLGKFVHSRHDLVGFMKNYGRFLEVLRYNELEADFESVRGDMVLETNLHALERSASKIFTKEVFTLVRPALARGSTMRVMGCTQLMSQTIFTVSKYGRSHKE
ncbi:FAR1 DNA-binding domain [Sesbania bispinosa]|nr:FAR1 DNA-binding domain [Sesbania bispinosa]